jgi:hypothetical protein
MNSLAEEREDDPGSSAAGLCRWGGKRAGGNSVICVLLLASSIAGPLSAHGQTVPEGDAGGFNLTVGATLSGDYVQYGDRKMLGVAAIADLDTRRRIGLEGEAHWVIFHQTANVHTSTYLIGPRYHLDLGKFQPYAKGLIGLGKFNYPYNYGQDNDLVAAMGAGVDYRITHRIRLRIADIEYQYWPKFHYGALSCLSVSAGIRVRIH